MDFQGLTKTPVWAGLNPVSRITVTLFYLVVLNVWAHAHVCHCEGTASFACK